MILVSRLVIVSPSPVPIVAMAPAVRAAFERLEYPLQIALVDADAGVLDREFGDLMAIADAETSRVPAR